MLFKLFNWLVKRKRVPYCAALVIPPDIWSILAGIFGLILIFVRADFEITGTGTITFLSLLCISALAVPLECGFLQLFGIKWERKRIKILNDNILNGHLRSNLSTPTLLEIYSSLEYLNKWLVKKHIQYISIVVIGSSLVEGLFSGQLINVSVILIAGFIAGSIAFICSAPLWELLMFPVRQRM